MSESWRRESPVKGDMWSFVEVVHQRAPEVAGRHRHHVHELLIADSRCSAKDTPVRPVIVVEEAPEISGRLARSDMRNMLVTEKAWPPYLHRASRRTLAGTIGMKLKSQKRAFQRIPQTSARRTESIPFLGSQFVPESTSHILYDDRLHKTRSACWLATPASLPKSRPSICRIMP